MAAGDFLRNRHTHAWGAVAVGVALLVGVVPLARAVSPHGSPWWVAPGLIAGGVLLLFGLILFVLPGAPATLGPPGPTAVLVDHVGDLRLAIVEERTNCTARFADPQTGTRINFMDPAHLTFNATLWVTNEDPRQVARLLRGVINLEYVEEEERFEELPCSVSVVGSNSATDFPLFIDPGQSVHIRVHIRQRAPIDTVDDGWYSPSFVAGNVWLIDQFNKRHATPTLLWES